MNEGIKAVGHKNRVLRPMLIQGSTAAIEKMNEILTIK